jgi:tripartite-type tricarboxylate transporter receptor subunit TctC
VHCYRNGEGNCHAVRDRDQEGWDSAEFKEFMNRRGFDVIYLDSAGFAEFMKADNEDNGKALKSVGLAK